MLLGSSWKQFFKASFIYTAFILTIVVGFIGLFIIDQVLRVQEIEIIQEGKKISIVGLQGYQNSNIVLLDTKEVAGSLKRENPSIDTITVLKEYPNKLNIHVTSRSAKVALKGDVGYYMLASDGTILQKVREEPKGLPRITYYQKLPFINYQAGQKIDNNDIALCIEFYNRFLKLGMKAQTIDVQDYSMIRFLFAEQKDSVEKEIRISAEKEMDVQWYQIERLIKALRIQGQDYKLIDVRFEKPYFEQITQ
jgi:hypothetical protein